MCLETKLSEILVSKVDKKLIKLIKNKDLHTYLEIKFTEFMVSLSYFQKKAFQLSKLLCSSLNLF